jgi:hypothetical protein
VLYYLLAGVSPYDGPNQLATLHLLTTGAPPPPLPPHLPAAVNALALRAMAHKAEHRIATAAELQRQLEMLMVECNVFTTSSDVAAYVGEHLGERSQARRKAVELALEAAAERGRMMKLLTPAATDSSTSVMPPGALAQRARQRAAAQAVVALNETGANPARATAASMNLLSPDLGAPGAMGAIGESEQPSQVSSATLGSGAMAFPARIARNIPPAQRHLVAVAMGVVGALVLAGTFGIVALVVRKQPPVTSAGSGGANTVASAAPALDTTAEPKPPAPSAAPAPLGVIGGVVAPTSDTVVATPAIASATTASIQTTPKPSERAPDKPRTTVKPTTTAAPPTTATTRPKKNDDGF